ncbi:DNA/RNA non-specific endonuclease [Neobacillus niacini]|uniref:DNA/RNA non-specific endonuclease n=1 Tax=Neobacillus niacini TaxID=86668 RepID=UPI002859F8E5|nr:DNA/RNA non-specific endonuclease [Neobacillus niacini]MDR6999644.1 hypothetical protein [Neobacillus niacini]
MEQLATATGVKVLSVSTEKIQVNDLIQKFSFKKDVENKLSKGTSKGTADGNSVNEVKEIDFGKHIIKGENGKKQLLPNTKYVTNDEYKYTTDELGRIVNVEAPELVLKKADRNKYAQANVGGKDRSRMGLKS